MQRLHMRNHGFEHVDGGVCALRRKIASLSRAGVNHAQAAVGHGERRESRQCGLIQPFGPLVLGQVKPVRWQRLVDRAAARMFHRLAPRLVIIRDLLEALARGVLALRLDRNRRVTEIIEQSIHPLGKQRQPMLHAGMAAALADRFVKWIVALRRAEGCDIAHPEAADGLGHQLKFRDRHQIERAHVQKRALGFRIEGADRFQRVAEEIESHGLVEACRKQIENAAAHGIFAGFAHGGGAVVAVVLQPRHDGVHRHHMAGRDRQRLRRDGFACRHPLHDGVDRRENDQRLVAALEPGQPRQRGQPLRQDSAMRRHPVVRLAVPGRKLHHRQIGCEEFQRARQLLHARAVAADHGETDRRRPRSRRDRARQIRDNQAFCALGDIGKGQRASRREQFHRRSCGLLHASRSARNDLMRSNRPLANSGAGGTLPVSAA